MNRKRLSGNSTMSLSIFNLLAAFYMQWQIVPIVLNPQAYSSILVADADARSDATPNKSLYGFHNRIEMSMFTSFTIFIIQIDLQQKQHAWPVYLPTTLTHSLALRTHSFIPFIHSFIRFAVFGGVFISKLFLIFTISKILVNVIPNHKSGTLPQMLLWLLVCALQTNE